MLTQRILAFSLIGGEWVLWLLVSLSLVSFAILFDRVILYLRTRESLPQIEPKLIAALGNDDMDTARSTLAGDGLIRNVLRAGVDVIAQGKESAAVEQAMLGALAREKSRYESRLNVLGTIGNNAPFVGLFGTVLGIILAFNQLGKLDASQASSNQLVMGAISEALVATGVGIAVAIPAVAAFNWAKSHVGGRLKDAEALMRAVLAGRGARVVSPNAAARS
ncbi:MAG: MotA/TolQ/ExbB proton channel family protein [Myxococcales bacterium]